MFTLGIDPEGRQHDSLALRVDAEATEDDLELARIAGTEIISEFSASTDIQEEIVIIPFPEKSADLEHLVFLRHEHNYHRT